MASTALPFLYQTRTIQRLASAPFRRHFCQTVQTRYRRRDPRYVSHDAIPFEDGIQGFEEDVAGQKTTTMTPSEAEIFKGIFEDITQGNMPRPSKFREKMLQREAAASDLANSTSGSLVEQARQARLSDFRENTLQRFPSSLRQAAEKALNLYTSEKPEEDPAEGILARAERQMKLLQEKEKFDREREAEMARLSQEMDNCKTDVALWGFLEKQVFTLPAKLGIVEEDAGAKVKKGKRTKKKENSNAVDGTNPSEAKYSMDVYGPMYSQLLLRALDQFDTAFPHTSTSAFNILTRVRSISLTSYVLGASTQFYTRLARIHWERFGDANSALDMIEEMNSIGLQPDVKVHDLLVRIRDELHACAAGAQGPFVAAMMESPPYDAVLIQRLDALEEYVRAELLDARGGEFAAE